LHLEIPIASWQCCARIKQHIHDTHSSKSTHSSRWLHSEQRVLCREGTGTRILGLRSRMER
jgi:hypothetical protein